MPIGNWDKRFSSYNTAATATSLFLFVVYDAPLHLSRFKCRGRQLYRHTLPSTRQRTRQRTVLLVTGGSWLNELMMKMWMRNKMVPLGWSSVVDNQTHNTIQQCLVVRLMWHQILDFENGKRNADYHQLNQSVCGACCWHQRDSSESRSAQCCATHG